MFKMDLLTLPCSTPEDGGTHMESASRCFIKGCIITVSCPAWSTHFRGCQEVTGVWLDVDRLFPGYTPAVSLPHAWCPVGPQ